MNTTESIGKDHLAIWGGTCSETEIINLIAAWPNRITMQYRIWEYTDHISIGNDDKPEGHEWLERGRMFGEGGDLSFRRVDEEFRWWFIGPKGINVPEKFNPRNFWKSGDPGASFNQENHTALLWGVRGKEEHDSLFWDDRVAGANLDYDRFPELKDAKRVAVEYQTYSRAGYVEFVWMRKLVEGKGGI